MGKLTKNQRLFCRCYSVTRNAREAAGLAGLKNPAVQGMLLMQSRQIREEISRLCAERAPTGEAAGGLRRLAFGSAADAVRLMLTGGEGLDIDALDLFCVSEIKLSRGGGMEIKFFDRIKALERLSGLCEPEEKPISSFVEALRKGAARLGDDGYGA